MKISNIRNMRVLYNGAFDHRYMATIDVTTGALWWKKTEARDICSTLYGHCWFFLDSGIPLPSLYSCLVKNMWDVNHETN